MLPACNRRCKRDDRPPSPPYDGFEGAGAGSATLAGASILLEKSTETTRWSIITRHGTRFILTIQPQFDRYVLWQHGSNSVDSFNLLTTVNGCVAWESGTTANVTRERRCI